MNRNEECLRTDMFNHLHDLIAYLISLRPEEEEDVLVTTQIKEILHIARSVEAVFSSHVECSSCEP